MGRSGIVATATAALLLLAGVAVPAAAAAPVPVPPVPLPPAVDSATHYDPQTVCDPEAKPGATALRDLLVATYGPATIYIPRACTSSTSEHFDGRAVDWMRSVRVPAEKEMADAFVDWLLAPAADGTPHEMARRLGIMYIIWNNRMIRMYDPARGWTDYRSCMDPANDSKSLDTSCHRNHVHISMSWDGAGMTTSWWTGVAMTRPSCPAGWTTATPGAGDAVVVGNPGALPGFVPVAATPILDTLAGSGGGITGSCRIRAGRALYAQGSRNGGPPGGGTAVVRLSTTSNAPAQVAVWSAGGLRPTGQVAVPIGTSAATVAVPLASDGTFGITTSRGAVDVSAAVIGYLPGPAPAPDPSQPSGSPDRDAVTASSDDGGAQPSAARPAKPRKVRATSKRRWVKVRWRPPTTDGGAAITGFTVQALTSRAKGASVAGSCTAGPDERSCKVRALKKGRRYWMSVSVTNEVGTSWAPRTKVRVRR